MLTVLTIGAEINEMNEVSPFLHFWHLYIDLIYILPFTKLFNKFYFNL